MTRQSFLRLTEEEEAKVDQLAREVDPHLQSCPSLRSFCTRSCYVRYLRARAWNVAKATKMLQETLAWRESYQPATLCAEELAREGSKGRMYILEKPDTQGRPVVIMRPREDPHPNDNDTRLKWLVYTLEAASRLADETDDGKMTWLIDYAGYTRKASPPLKVSLATLHILQNHYPERLGRAVCFHPPAIFDLLWRAVWPFIDPVTYRKVVFINKKSPSGAMGEYFDLEGLDDSMGGRVPVDTMFDWEQYSCRMLQQYEQATEDNAAEAEQMTNIQL